MDLECDTDRPGIISNKNYQKDVNFTMQYTRLLLSLLGIWPMVSKNAKFYEKVIFKFVVIVVSSLMLFVTIPCLIHMIYREKDATARLVMTGPISFCLASILKYSSIIYRRKMIANCFEHMEKDWKDIGNNRDWKIMRQSVQVGRDLTVVCGVFLYTCTFGYHLIMPLCTGVTINELNETLRPLVFPGYDLFVDAQNSPVYEFVLYGCFVGSFINSTIAITSCNLAAIFVVHACGQFEIVVSRLKTLLDSLNDVRNGNDIVQERIKFLVRNHVRVLGFSTKIEEVLREICCIEVVASTLIICLDEYYCMMEWKNSDIIAILTYIGVLISLSFNIFIFCHIGELLKEQLNFQGFEIFNAIRQIYKRALKKVLDLHCDNIERAAYMSDWYKLPGKSGLAIMLIIGTRNCPRRITAGRMMELSISSFGAIMKNTLASLNMLRAIGY